MLTTVRTFKSGTQLTVDYRHGSWFVMMKLNGEQDFTTHCGPYATMGEAIDWIKAVREEKT